MLNTYQRVKGLSGEKVYYFDLGFYSKISSRGIKTYFQNQPQCIFGSWKPGAGFSQS